LLLFISKKYNDIFEICYLIVNVIIKLISITVNICDGKEKIFKKESGLDRIYFPLFPDLAARWCGHRDSRRAAHDGFFVKYAVFILKRQKSYVYFFFNSVIVDLCRFNVRLQRRIEWVTYNDIFIRELSALRRSAAILANLSSPPPHLSPAHPTVAG
jgi:hypothetical protein